MNRPAAAKPVDWFPRRGEICWFRLDKVRPALVISSDVLNEHSLDVCVVPISTAEHKQFSLRPRLEAGEGGLQRDSWAKCDHPSTLEKRCAIYPPLGTISHEAMLRIEQAVRDALEL